MTLIKNDVAGLDWSIGSDYIKSLETEPEPKFKCPRSVTCVMDCYHKYPHKYEEKYCNGLDGHCNTKCVHELISDVTFFKEDFERS